MTGPNSTVEKLSLSLNEAAMKGDIEMAKAAISLGAEVQFNHNIALRSAAKGGHVETIELLVKHGADLHAMNDDALRAAAKNGRDAVVAKLLALGADADAQEGEALIQSATKGFSAIARSLLEHHANPHFFDDHALRQAAYNGHLDIVQALAQNKADLFSMRGSAAELASSEKHTAIVEYLAIAMNDQRQAFLSDLGAATSRDFLRQSYRDTGEPALVRAVKMNCVQQAIAHMKQAGDSLTAADMQGLKDRRERPLGVVAAEYGKLGNLFDIDLWKGSLADVQEAWNAIPEGLRKNGGATEEDFAGIIAGFNQRTLKDKAGRVKLKF